jgi:8-oxo-dGTP diphosphatase
VERGAVAGSARAFVAVDVAAFCVAAGRLETYLVTVREGPFAGRWAFPGRLIESDESLEQAALGEIDLPAAQRDLLVLEQLHTFGDPHRDPRGRVVSTAYLALLPDRKLMAPSGRYGRADWFAVETLPPLAYDHDEVVAAALERLRGKLAYTNIVYGLLPRRFTFAELQRVYEVILGRDLDRRNFRKKMLATGLLRPVSETRRGAHRPAQLFEFAERRLVAVDIL